MVSLSNGNSFLPGSWWTANPYYGNIGSYFSDVTGDGMADAIAVNTSGVTVRPSDSAAFLPNETWTTNPFYGDLFPVCPQVAPKLDTIFRRR
jgi:hypothetical protein